ncbi:unnamed protein product [Rotaria sordida]|uniref:DNA helicase n=1 Tax=Rotaria sordida TaxID=392033 RepID=A0A816BNP9_9BILA|nr:unnamed protein product [Rotaria sordida]CAF1612883.1 unnamed protein product [Rotaria sordida]
MFKEWKRDIEAQRDETRNYLILGEDTLEIRDDEIRIEIVGTEIPPSPIKTKVATVLPVTATNAILFPTKQDIVKQFTLNIQQKYAFMIVTSHLVGEHYAYTGTIDNQLLMCIPGCGGTEKSHLIRAITKYFQVTKRGKMLRKLAPTSIAPAEIDGLTIHSFLGAPILVFRNTLRTQINNRAVLNKTMEMGLTPIVCIAQDYIQGKIVDDLQLRQAILELPDNKTEHLPGYLPLVPGMPVLLTENVASELGLSNGTRGIFHQLVYDESPEDVRYHNQNFPPNTKFITQPKYALVEFPGCKLDEKLAQLSSKRVPIAISEQTFLFDAKELPPENVAKVAKINKKTTKLTVKRKALPLIPTYSMTTHKSQGQTLGKIIVRLDDILIIRPFVFGTLQVKPSTPQIEELKRLDRIAQNTRKRFQFIA